MSSGGKGTRSAGGGAPHRNKEILAKDIADAFKKVFGQKADVYGDKYMSDISFTSFDDSIQMQRYVKLDNGQIVVQHELLILDKELQGKGLASKFLKKSIDAYEMAGVDKVVMWANKDVGGYAWAITGYKTTKEHAFMVAQGTPWAEKIVNNYFKKNPQKNDFPMNLLAKNGEASKKMLKGKHWDAFINMNDKQQMSYIKGYLNNKVNQTKKK